MSLVINQVCECPLGGDEANDCDGCAYSGDYHFDAELKECARRPEEAIA